MKPNQTRLFKYIAGLNLLMTPIAFAQTGDRGGNGGDVIVCPDRSVRMLDTIEAAQHGTIAHFPAGAVTLRKKVEAMIERQMKKDRVLGRSIQSFARPLLNDLDNFEVNKLDHQANSIIREGELPNISDEGATFVPVGCKIEQLIIRTQNPLPNQKTFAIRKDLLERMTTEEKAIAVIHESIYAHLVSNKINSSPSARWYNGLLFSNEIERVSDANLVMQMDAFQFPKESLSNWQRLSYGFIYDPLTAVTYASDGSIEKIASAKIDPASSFAWISNSNMIPVFVKDVVLKNGSWQKMTFDKKWTAEDRGATNYRFDAQTKEVLYWEEMWGGTQPLISVGILKKLNLKNRNVLGLEKATLERTSDGYRILRAQKFQWQLDKQVFIPIIGLTCLGYPISQRWIPTSIELDRDFNILEIHSPKTPWSRMERY